MYLIHEKNRICVREKGWIDILYIDLLFGEDIIALFF